LSIRDSTKVHRVRVMSFRFILKLTMINGQKFNNMLTIPINSKLISETINFKHILIVEIDVDSMRF
jgi:hypothetical protein